MPSTDSIEGKSSSELKQMLMQTSVPDSGEEEETEQAVETAEETEEETKLEETAEEAETKKDVSKKEEAAKTYKLRTKKGEVEVDEDKIIALAQQGEDYNQKMAKLKEWESELERKATGQPATPFGNMPIEKVNEYLVKELNDNPAATLANFMNLVAESRDAKAKEDKRIEREYKTKLAETLGDTWYAIKPTYDEYREDGHSRDTALAMARADFYQQIANKALERGIKKGEKKAKMKTMAEIPAGEKRARSESEIPSTKDLSKMTSAEIRKYLKYVKHPDW